MSRLPLVTDSLKASSVDPRQLIQKMITDSEIWMSDTPLRWCFDSAVLLSAFYYLIMTPLLLVSPSPWYPDHQYLLAIEIFATITLISDVYVKAKTCKTYLRTSGFAVDVMTAAPIDIGIAFFDLDWVYFAAMCLRLGKWSRMHTLFKFSGMGIVTAGHVKWKYRYVPLVKTAMNAIAFAHTVSCLFIVTTCSYLNDNDAPCLSRPSGIRYIKSLYWTMYTISSVGYGDIEIKTTSAYILSTCLFAIALIVNGWLIGKVTSYMMMVDTEGEHRELMNRTLQVIQHFGLDDAIIDDVLSLQEHLLSQKIHLKSFNDVVDRLPSTVQSHLSLYMRVDYLGQIPIFKHTSGECKIALAHSLMHNVYGRGEYVVVAGEEGDALYVVVHGFAQVLKADGTPIAALMKNSFFGEIALLENTTRTASVKCISYCEMLMMKKEAFDSITVSFPLLRYYLEVEMCKRTGAPEPPHPLKAKKRKRTGNKVQQAKDVEKYLNSRALQGRVGGPNKDEICDDEDDLHGSDSGGEHRAGMAPLPPAMSQLPIPGGPSFLGVPSRPPSPSGADLFTNRADSRFLTAASEPDHDQSISRRGSYMDDDTVVGARSLAGGNAAVIAQYLKDIIHNQKVMNKKLNKLVAKDKLSAVTGAFRAKFKR
eukprot:TRINITY_DN9603_c0_g1_i1.p1 TRINITY_DN9603_c0_g1~~TRINITY_DN9603_c0_g1_i1.p1  ORF type:complete len:728 (+),score=89.58 TRINITY_DN9603_c0_g1_i1:243-2186(+)